MRFLYFYPILDSLGKSLDQWSEGRQLGKKKEIGLGFQC